MNLDTLLVVQRFTTVSVLYIAVVLFSTLRNSEQSESAALFEWLSGIESAARYRNVQCVHTRLRTYCRLS